MDMLLSFDTGDDGGKRHKGYAIGSRPIKRDAQPEFPGATIECDCESVEAVELSDGREIHIFSSKALFGPGGNLHDLTKGAHEVALIELGKYTLICRSEPTADGRLAIEIADRRDRVLLTGIGDVFDELTVEGRTTPAQLVFSFHIAHPYRRWSPAWCAHTGGTVRNPGTTPVKLK